MFHHNTFDVRKPIQLATFDFTTLICMNESSFENTPRSTRTSNVEKTTPAYTRHFFIYPTWNFRIFHKQLLNASGRMTGGEKHKRIMSKGLSFSKLDTLLGINRVVWTFSWSTKQYGKRLFHSQLDRNSPGTFVAFPCTQCSNPLLRDGNFSNPIWIVFIVNFVILTFKY